MFAFLQFPAPKIQRTKSKEKQNNIKNKRTISKVVNKQDKVKLHLLEKKKKKYKKNIVVKKKDKEKKQRRFLFYYIRI